MTHRITHRATWALAAVLLSAAGLAACTQDATRGALEDAATTLELNADGSGDLEFCDGDGTCYTLENPRDCATVTVEFDPSSGSTCEVCEGEAGDVLYEGCDDPSVECVLVTAPEPDCVVCSRPQGAVVYSTCVSTEPEYCTEQQPFEFDDFTCRVCTDERGQIVLDECPRDPNCTDVCIAAECPPDQDLIQRPGECCPTCVPRANCEEDWFCPFEISIPDCPPWTELIRDPTDCCQYLCVPFDCFGSDGGGSGPIDPEQPCASDADCFSGLCMDGWCVDDSGFGAPPPQQECPPGYAADFSYPNCGSCVPVDNSVYCLDDSECAIEEFCTVTEECLFPDEGGCGCVDECDATTGECFTICAECACYGICRGDNVVCADTTQPDPFACVDGEWQFAGRDSVGCPLPPVCFCYDGGISADGSCPDSCAGVVCPAVEILCGPDEHIEYGNPFCCGVCVPNDQCWTTGLGECAFIDCGPGYACQLGAACQPTCVPESEYCFATEDCIGGQVCTTAWGECLISPTCDIAGDPGCTECAGICVWDDPDPSLQCTITAECGPDEICTTEFGDCLPAPGCDPNDFACISVCGGTCEPAFAPDPEPDPDGSAP